MPAAAFLRICPVPVTDRALFHADNAYYYPDVRVSSHPMRTNTVSNTAFRGFGGPQGVIVAERMIEEIAYALGRDPLEIRKLNLYQNGQLTPYHQEVTDQILPRIFRELEASSDYQARRQAVLDWNAKGGTIRKGIALTPVKFGISFTATWFNQAGALIHIYNDGSIALNHGGTEMGQGPEHQGRAGRGRGIPMRYQPHQDHPHHDRKGAQYLRPRPPLPARTSTAWRRWMRPIRSRRGWSNSSPNAGRSRPIW